MKTTQGSLSLASVSMEELHEGGPYKPGLTKEINNSPSHGQKSAPKNRKEEWDLHLYMETIEGGVQIPPKVNILYFIPYLVVAVNTNTIYS